MNNNDIHEMSELYRKTRISVYEEATRPLSNNPDKHRENKDKLKKHVINLCNNADLNKYIGIDKHTATAIWHHLWTKNRYAGIRSQIATTEINDIKFIFDNYTLFAEIEWDIEASGHTLISAGQQIHNFLNRAGDFTGKQTIGNIPKLSKLVSVARQLNDFMNKKDANKQVLDFIRNDYKNEDIWAIHRHLMDIGYRSDLTVLHFMMDLGFQVIKPDIVISKIFLDRGWLQKKIPSLPDDLSLNDLKGEGKYGQRYKYTDAKIYKPIIDLAREIVSVTCQKDLQKDIGWVSNNPIREFDIFLVKYGQLPERESGIDRTLFKVNNLHNKPSKSCSTKIHE